jgi:hypothetical protein
MKKDKSLMFVRVSSIGYLKYNLVVRLYKACLVLGQDLPILANVVKMYSSSMGSRNFCLSCICYIYSKGLLLTFSLWQTIQKWPWFKISLHSLQSWSRRFIKWNNGGEPTSLRVTWFPYGRVKHTALCYDYYSSSDKGKSAGICKSKWLLWFLSWRCD